jgi:hypothetical protein
MMADSGASQNEAERHWDAAYLSRGHAGVSWFQPAATVSVALIRHLAVPKEAAIIDIGGGASHLVDALVTDGFSDVTVLDISSVALGTLRERLDEAAPVTLVHADLLSWKPTRQFDVWHDRAVFHFLVDKDARKRYLEAFHLALRSGGTAIVGTFASDGPEYCSGLPVARYTPDELSSALGDDLVVVAEKREQHITPAGVTQPFTWVAARRWGLGKGTVKASGPF